jgi:LuxR family transcriptional regulator, maltose regulon positive regulatory protein
MSKPELFLRTKLLPPRAVSELLPRPRLTEKLKANINASVTMVAADAGCGKTTLISDFIRSETRPYVWYQLDHTDADPFVFLGYITHGIRNFAPDFGETVLPYLTEARDELLRFPERAVDLLLNEILENIKQPFIIVLDDYHHIGRDTVVHTLVDRLLQYSSELIHLIITTRDLPPLAIMRRRSQNAAFVLTRDDLLFTEEEMRALFRQTLNIELRDEEVTEYRERTHGWITALQLVRQAAEQEIDPAGNQPRVDLSDILHRSEKDIFDYFAEEVFLREPEDIRELLPKLSLLDSLPLDICSRLFPDMRCAAVLPELLHKNVFLTVAGDDQETEVYRLHPLFRDFLQRRLRTEIGRAGLEKERIRIADFFFAEKQWEKALPFFLETGSYERAAEIIAENGAEWIGSGAITTLENFIAGIPQKELEKHPYSLLHKAEILRLRGEEAKSFTLLNRAVTLLADAKNKLGEAEARHSLASLLRRKGDCDAALAELEKAEKLVGRETETHLKCANTRGLCLIAQGSWTQAEQQFRLALELAEKQGNEHFIRLITHNLALPAGFRGDFGEALRWFKRIFRVDKNNSPFPQEAIGYLNVARLHIFRGEFAGAERNLEQALEICQLFNLTALRGEVFEAFGNFYREKHDLVHAAEFYERALKAYEDAGVNLAARDLDEERARFFLLRGDTARAKALLEALLKAREGSSNEFGEKTVELSLCKVKLAGGETEGLSEKVAELTKFFHEQNLNYDEANASLLSAEIFFAAGSWKEIYEPLQRALDLAARFDYDHWLRREIKNSKLFRDEDILEKLPPDLRENIAASDPPEAIATVESMAEAATGITDLTVNVLGFVDIFRDRAKPFAADAWTTRRAREIFCYIATSKHRRVEKDVLMDVFWGDEEISVIEKNFHPTISHIRKALNSRQTFKQNFLVFRDGAYQLNPELSFFIDTEEFEKHLSAAENAKREKNDDALRLHLEAAHELYRGEFSAGVYENWAEERRHYYFEQYSRILNALAKLAFSERRWSKAVKFADDILKTDPFREDAHRLLMKVYAAQGKRASVIEQFESLQTLLKKELGVEPAPETRQVYRELTK